MCGLTGFLQCGGGSEVEMSGLVRRMTDTLKHRGPNGAGMWVAPSDGIAFGFRRLAILDLTPSGDQPMISANARFVIVFNGEIYNHRELKAELQRQNVGFRGTSDTEVILEGAAYWGVDEVIPKLWGMFAIALWDRREKKLVLVRDRLGKKPLYYTASTERVIFGSELKSLSLHPQFRKEVDRGALSSYLRFGYVPSPYSIYKDTFKVPPGTYVVIRPNTLPEVHQYWNPHAMAHYGTADPLTLNDDEAVAELEVQLLDAVARRMISDVPLGAMLSGGVDSSLVVALMQAQSSQPVKTYTIGFHSASYNEAEAAKTVAHCLGTDHTELYLSHEDALAVIPHIPTMYDEPFADSSQIPTYLVCALARRNVTVSLSGDGGDELFAGYVRYALAERIWKTLRLLPLTLRHLTARTIRKLSPTAWNSLFAMATPVLPSRWRFPHMGDKLHKLSELFTSEDPDALYQHLVSQWKTPELLTFGVPERASPITDTAMAGRMPGFTQRMMLLDLVSYLPDDILVKVDRASMAVSLEARCPLLDHRLLEWVWRLPMHFKIRNGHSKWLLRNVLYKYVPPALIERPKMGFGIPLADWLRGPLRDWAEAQLTESRLRLEGFFDPSPIRQAWRQHLSGAQNEQYRLWVILMFQAWLERWVR